MSVEWRPRETDMDALSSGMELTERRHRISRYCSRIILAHTGVRAIAGMKVLVTHLLMPYYPSGLAAGEGDSTNR
jgi:hypothetical protein